MTAPILAEVDLGLALRCSTRMGEEPRCRREAVWRLVFECQAEHERISVLTCHKHRESWVSAARTWCKEHGKAPARLVSVGRL